MRSLTGLLCLTFYPPVRGEEKKDRSGFLVAQPGHCLSCQVDLRVLGFVRIDLSLAGQTEAGGSSLAGDSEDHLIPERSRRGGPQVSGATIGRAGYLLSLPDSRPQVL